MQILLIEDATNIVSVMRHYIDDTEHQMLVAKSMQQALEFYKKKQPDLVILDTEVQHINSFTCAKKIRQLQGLNDWVPILYLSNKPSESLFRSGADAGVDDYLEKPINNNVLTAKINAMERVADMRQKLLQTTRRLAEANHQLSILSRTDELTGIANRRAFNEALRYEWRRSCRLQGTDQAISLLMIDIDNFKHYNDTYGHQAGDHCLQLVAHAIQASLKRTSDFLFRYGGEEFAILLTNTQLPQAEQLAEQIRQTIQHLQIPHQTSQPLKIVTISLGVSAAMAQKSRSATLLLKSSDDALYQAKKKGRNQVQTKLLQF